MAHFAILNESNIVTRVEVINNAVLLDGDGVEQEQLGIDFLTSLYGAGNYKQTSYNKKIRKNYPGLPNSRWIAMRLLDADADIIKALKNGDFDQVLT